MAAARQEGPVRANSGLCAPGSRPGPRLTRERLLKRVRSLLTVADPRHGATEPERATARRLADALMAENGLREADVPEREVERAAPPPPPPQYVFVIQMGELFGNGNNNTTNGGWPF